MPINLPRGINSIDMLTKTLRLVSLLLLITLLTGCMYWLRAYQVYLQMSEFDRYFSVKADDNFTLYFKTPVLLSEDFVSLSKLYASEDMPTADGRRWRYRFLKIDGNNKPVKPEISFYSELNFNKDHRLTSWSFSHIFLQIAPPKFLEVSLRSIGGASIDKENRQLRANPETLKKISADLPKKPDVLAHLGKPLIIEDEPEQEIYIYHFLLQTPHIEEGYEDRALNEIKITFDKKTRELVRMSGRFAGLKASINYRKFVEHGESNPHVPKT